MDCLDTSLRPPVIKMEVDAAEDSSIQNQLHADEAIPNLNNMESNPADTSLDIRGKPSAIGPEIHTQRQTDTLGTETDVEKEPWNSDDDVDTGNKIMQVSVSKERSVTGSGLTIKTEPPCMAVDLTTKRDTSPDDVTAQMKEKDPVVETDVVAMKQRMLMEVEDSIKKEPLIIDSDHSDPQDLPVMSLGRTARDEPSLIERVANIKNEPEPGLTNGSAVKPDQPVSDLEFNAQLVIKSEPVETPASELSLKRKLIIKLKSRAIRNSGPASKRAARETVDSRGKDTAQQVGDLGSLGVVVKCEPFAGSGSDADCEAAAEDGQRKKKRGRPLEKGKNKVSPECSHCQQVFCSRSSLKRHYRRKHSNENLPFVCKECDAVFARMIQLRAHIRLHKGGEKMFPCQLCDVSFTRACHLKVHMRKHTGERPFTCTDCNATFRSTSNLNRHMMKHSGLRPYICTVCNADFYQSSHLVSHVRKHTGERPFRCVDCQATFTQLTHLHRHMAKHTGKKPHLCYKCGLGFVENCSLQRHMQTHSGKTRSKAAGGKVTKELDASEEKHTQQS